MRSDVFYFEAIVQVSKDQLKDWDPTDELFDVVAIQEDKRVKKTDPITYTLTVISFYDPAGILDAITGEHFKGIKSFRTRSVPGNETIILRTFHEVSLSIGKIIRDLSSTENLIREVQLLDNADGSKTEEVTSDDKESD